ncbi:Riboflavin synthase alpha chain [Nowakowskiella sp. JEL0078]|nr:Riboflavin synthase alpha chain [Nowakowskiella sp. JEL0078]
MFTGIVEALGRVAAIVPLDVSQSGGGGFSITISNAEVVLVDVNLGDSIAINGVCLTVTEFNEQRTEFKVGISPETLRKTNLGDLKIDDLVNLERAMSANTRFGGHFVQGHVDTTVRISFIKPDPPNSIILQFTVPPPEPITDNIDFMRYIIPKGFISLNGTSLTIVSVDKASRTFSVMLIAYTQEKVNLLKYVVGDRINIEVDQIAKYVDNVASAMLSENTTSSVDEAVIERVVRRILAEK